MSQGQAIDIGKSQILNDEIGVVLSQFGDGGSAIHGFDDFVSLSGERQPYNLAGDCIVFYDQYGLHRSLLDAVPTPPDTAYMRHISIVR
jgi:hypothetical protein